MARTACDGDWRTGFCLYAGTPANEEMDCGRLRAAHLDQVVRLSPALMALNVLSAGLVCVAHGLPWTPVMTVWLLALVGVVFLGMRAWWMWRGRDVQRVSVRTFHHGTKHSALLGAVWGAAAAIWVPEGAGLQMLLAAHQILPHDLTVGTELARVLTGGDCSSTVRVTEQYVLDLEREAFLKLCGEEKTRERMTYMLQNNKPLRN